jgi:hypothetical protein
VDPSFPGKAYDIRLWEPVVLFYRWLLASALSFQFSALSARHRALGLSGISRGLGVEKIYRTMPILKMRKGFGLVCWGCGV